MLLELGKRKYFAFFSPFAKSLRLPKIDCAVAFASTRLFPAKMFE